MGCKKEKKKKQGAKDAVADQVSLVWEEKVKILVLMKS